MSAPVKIDLSNETAGAEPKGMVAVVGIWRVEDDNEKKLPGVDGQQMEGGAIFCGHCRQGTRHMVAITINTDVTGSGEHVVD